MSIKVYPKLVAKCDELSDARFRYYPTLDKNIIAERREVSGESDFYTVAQVRESHDGGKTFGEWKDSYSDTYSKIEGTDDEVLWVNEKPKLYDPKSGCFVTCAMQRYFVGGHLSAYDSLWGAGKQVFFDHCYLYCYNPITEERKYIPVMFDGGSEFSKSNPRNPDFLERNICYFGNVSLADNGDILFPIGADLRACCKILGVDVNEVFPSCPSLMRGMILVRAHWNGKTYELSYSRPVVISDLMSSRGVCEPCAAQLKSGRIIVVFRGSNVISEEWNTRIDRYALPCKWYMYSDDNGKTFSPAMPYVFDTREVVYSSATMPYLFRSSKSGKLYWIGNITPPEKTEGNFPRYPLFISEVDDNFGALKKDTLTVIDTKRDDETEFLQLSNLDLFENLNTGRLEIRLCKIGRTDPDCPDRDSESWEYEIEFE